MINDIIYKHLPNLIIIRITVRPINQHIPIYFNIYIYRYIVYSIYLLLVDKKQSKQSKKHRPRPAGKPEGPGVTSDLKVKTGHAADIMDLKWLLDGDSMANGD